jgi:peptidylprolyl isomerase
MVFISRLFMRALLLTFSLLLSSLSFATQDEGIFAHIQTNKGEIVIELAYEKAPLTVINFISLAEGTKASNKELGVPFYDGINFHRVIANFMVQGGDPKGTGTGGPGYKFIDEFSDLKHDKPGILSMANSGPGTNGSQFFITHIATPWLDGKHSVFGFVTLGMNVVNSIEKGDTIERVTIERVGENANNFATGEDAFNAALALKSLALKGLQEKQQQTFRETVVAAFPGAQQNDSGYFSLTTQAGTGKQAKAGNNISLEVTIELIDGRVLQASGKPVQFRLSNGEILGIIDDTALNMTLGEVRLAITTYQQAFGSRDMGIPMDSILVFKLKRLSNGE